MRTTLWIAICVLMHAMLTACGGGGGAEQAASDAGGRAQIASVQIAAGDAQTGIVGEEMPAALAARVLDSKGVPIVGQVVNFRVTVGGGSVFAGAASTDADGYARERWTLGTVAGPQQIEVRAVDANGLPVVFARFSATAIAGPAASVSYVSGVGQSALQLSTLPVPLQVRVLDRYGNGAPGATIAFSASDAGSASPHIVISDAAGLVSTSWTMGRFVGYQYLTASFSTGASVKAEARSMQAPPGAPVTLNKISGDSQSVVQHSLVGLPLEVELLDANGNGVPGVTVAFAAAGSALANPTTALTDSFGKARWRGYVHTVGAQQVVATVTGLGSVAFALDVAASAHRFDGAYACIVSELGRTSIVPNLDVYVINGVVSGQTTSGREIPNSPAATLDESTGQFHVNMKWSLDVTVELTGTFTVDGADRATGAGSAAWFVILRPSGTTAWSCDRR